MPSVKQDAALLAEADAAAARQQRNSLLAASDWTQVADAPVDRQAWATYRQQLRDLPETVTDFENIVWPQQPQT